jgi:hypothetical protein
VVNFNRGGWSVYSGICGQFTPFFPAYATNSAGTGYGNEFSFKTRLRIGEYYQGGYIVYLLEDKDPGYSASTQHGLIAAATDQSVGIAWITGGSTQTTTNGNTLMIVGSGSSNTKYMKSQLGYTGGAAKVCDDYSITSNGVTYSDWYLPSFNELFKLGILFELKSNGSPIADTFYWSSSESSNGLVFANSWINMGTINTNTSKNKIYRVKAFRSF